MPDNQTLDKEVEERFNAQFGTNIWKFVRYRDDGKSYYVTINKVVEEFIAQEIHQAVQKAVESDRENTYLMAEVGGFLAGISGELDNKRKKIAKDYAKRLGVETTN